MNEEREVSGVITPGNRFKTIEDTLIRIETKLDSKVDSDTVERMLRRIELIEAGETPLAKALMNQWEHMKEQLSDLIMHGSQNAQLAVNKTAELELKFRTLELDYAKDCAVREERQKDESRRNRAKMRVIGAVSAGASVFAALAYVHPFH